MCGHRDLDPSKVVAPEFEAIGRSGNRRRLGRGGFGADQIPAGGAEPSLDLVGGHAGVQGRSLRWSLEAVEQECGSLRSRARYAVDVGRSTIFGQGVEAAEVQHEVIAVADAKV